jgi:DNA-binding CsgD family transcriptional regulator
VTELGTGDPAGGLNHGPVTSRGPDGAEPGEAATDSRCPSARAMLLFGRGVDRADAVKLSEAALVDEDCLDSPLCVWRALNTFAAAGELGLADAFWLALSRSGRSGLGEVLTLSRARWARLQGDLETSHRLLRSLIQEGVSQPVRQLALPWLAELLLQKGEHRAAHGLMYVHEFSRVLAEPGPVKPMYLAARAVLYQSSGLLSEALEDFLACGQGLVEANLVNPAVLRWRSEAALMLVRLGEVEQGRALVKEELAASLDWGAPLYVGCALYAQAKVEGFAGQADLVDEAIDLLELAGARTELGRACYEHGQWLAEAGDMTAARQRLTRAGSLATWTGQEQRRSDVERALSRLGTSDVAVGLTRQEAKIAKLAKAGYQNKEIAEKLFLTVRTVEFHLSSVYRKLGVSGRRQLRTSAVVLP